MGWGSSRGVELTQWTPTTALTKGFETESSMSYRISESTSSVEKYRHNIFTSSILQ